jgi:hypothetical protein
MPGRNNGAVGDTRKRAGIGIVVISSPSGREARDTETTGFLGRPAVQYEKGTVAKFDHPAVCEGDIDPAD